VASFVNDHGTSSSGDTLVKQGNTTTKKREKHLFDDDDLECCVISLWTEPDHVFIHEVMRSQLTFLTMAYCYSGARIGAFVHNFIGEVKTQDGEMEKVVFQVLTWKASLWPFGALRALAPVDGGS
jgi:hypothetical protein